MARPGFGGQPSSADNYRVGRRIRVPEVRVIGADGAQIGVMPTHEAMRMAEEQGLELVEVNPRAAPPVCRIMDFGKFKYETSKKEKESRKHQSTVVIKEVKLRPKTDVHDLEFKLKHIRRFLVEGNKCKLAIVFRGREIVHPETGQAMLDTIVKYVTDIANVEQKASMEGRRMIMVIGPKAGVIKPGGDEDLAALTGQITRPIPPPSSAPSRPPIGHHRSGGATFGAPVGERPKLGPPVNRPTLAPAAAPASSAPAPGSASQPAPGPAGGAPNKS